MERIAALLIGYLIGSFQTGYLVGKLYGIDIREYGSKNAGMTNVNRTLGKKPALLVFIVDILKAVLAFILVPIIITDASWSVTAWSHVFPYDIGFSVVLLGLYAGFGAILGHDFPFFMRFKGGKGVSCTLGLVLMLNWQIALITYAIGFLIVLRFRYISLASLTITLLTPILLALFGYNPEVVIVAALFCGLAWFLHRDNIKRLLVGTERRFELKSTGTLSQPMEGK